MAPLRIEIHPPQPSRGSYETQQSDYREYTRYQWREWAGREAQLRGSLFLRDSMSKSAANLAISRVIAVGNTYRTRKHCW